MGSGSGCLPTSPVCRGDSDLRARSRAGPVGSRAGCGRLVQAAAKVRGDLVAFATVLDLSLQATKASAEGTGRWLRRGGTGSHGFVRRGIGPIADSDTNLRFTPRVGQRDPSSCRGGGNWMTDRWRAARHARKREPEAGDGWPSCEPSSRCAHRRLISDGCVRHSPCQRLAVAGPVRTNVR